MGFPYILFKHTRSPFTTSVFLVSLQGHAQRKSKKNAHPVTQDCSNCGVSLVHQP